MSREAYPEVIEILSNFSTKSFTELQAAAYIALLLMGEESGSAVAAQAGINRSKIYDILNQLEEMGAVEKVSRDGRSKYIAKSPDDLLPNMVNRFKADIDNAKQVLNKIKNLEQEVDPANFTLTTLEIPDLDTNSYEYLISSNERVRVEFTHMLDSDNRPSKDVKILDLNDNRDVRGMILLLNENEGYLFGTPTGKKVDAIKISSTEIALFFKFIIESKWTSDLPENVMDDIKMDRINALFIDKALFVQYDFYPTDDGPVQEHRYERPISFLVTDEHISFFYVGAEELKIPLIALSKIWIDKADYINVILENPHRKVGELRMKTVSNPYYLKNTLELIKRINTI